MGSVLALVRGPPQGNDESSQVQFPPRSGCYFGSYFIMGGEHFNTGNDSYLFGEPNDLTFLNRRPASFPYPAPAASEPSKTLQSLVNIRRDSVRLVRSTCTFHEGVCTCGPRYTLQMIIDADAPCAVRVLTQLKEDAVAGAVREGNTRAWRFPAGIGQKFDEWELSDVPSGMFRYSSGEPVPIIIHVEVEEMQHTHLVLCALERAPDNSCSIRILKQKQVIDGISFILQEIYGMESKGSADKSVGNGECVVCLNAPRDTMILPCRHLCLCYSCAEDVRFKSNVCLMCRQPFRALLRIEALQRIVSDESDGRTEDDKFERVDLVQYKCPSSLDSRSIGDSEMSVPIMTDISVECVGLEDMSGVPRAAPSEELRETSLARLPEGAPREERGEGSVEEAVVEEAPAGALAEDFSRSDESDEATEHDRFLT